MNLATTISKFMLLYVLHFTNMAASHTSEVITCILSIFHILNIQNTYTKLLYFKSRAPL